MARRTSRLRGRIVLDGCYAHLNAGDEAIFATVVRRIAVLAPGAELVAFTSQLEVSPFLRALPVRFVPAMPVETWADRPRSVPALLRRSDRARWWLLRWQARRLAARLRADERRGRGDNGSGSPGAPLASAHLLWHTGGGYVNDLFARASAVRKLLSAEVAHRLGVPVVISGQGIGPVTHPFTRRLARHFFRLAHEVTLRDQEVSRRELQPLGVGQSTPETGDDAAALSPCSADRRIEVLRASSADPDAMSAALHVRLAAYSTTDPTLLNWTAGVVRRLLETTPIRQVLLVPMSVSPRLDERVAYRELLRMLPDRPVRLLAALAPPDLKGVIAGCAVALGVSYHFGVFALSAGVPFVAICTSPYYRLKSEGLLRMYGQPQYAFDWSGDPARVGEAADAILRDPAPLRRAALARQEQIVRAQAEVDRRWISLAERPLAAGAARVGPSAGAQR